MIAGRSSGPRVSASGERGSALSVSISRSSVSWRTWAFPSARSAIANPVGRIGAHRQPSPVAELDQRVALIGIGVENVAEQRTGPGLVQLARLRREAVPAEVSIGIE